MPPDSPTQSASQRQTPPVAAAEPRAREAAGCPSRRSWAESPASLAPQHRSTPIPGPCPIRPYQNSSYLSGMNVLLTEMMARADASQVPGLSRFFKTGPGQYGEGDKFLGIKVPVTREVVKSTWRLLDVPWDRPAQSPSRIPFPELEECIQSDYHELRLAALLALVEIFHHQRKTPSNQRTCIDFYLAHTDRINNWDLVDLSCYPLLGEWLLDKDRTLLYDLARHGRTLWEQRIGIVSTMTFIRAGQLDDTFAIADILLHHPHDLIHKAVGWLLREAGKRDRAALEAWLQTPDPAAEAAPRYLAMPRTALRYAIEKFPAPLRQQYLSGHAH